MSELNLRRSQLIVPFGVGAIVNMPEQSLMACCIDDWEKDKNAGQTIFDERLQKRLKVKCFKTPSSAEKYPKGLPFVRFPKWLFCPQCRSFKPVNEWKELAQKEGRNDFGPLRCNNHPWHVLVPARFIVACPKGHIDDFPWVEWVHRGKICKKPDLRYTSGGGSMGLEGIKIDCETCGCNQRMVGAFDKEVFERLNIRCSGYKPWARSREHCNNIPMTLQRGATNVYFPKLVSSIIIPPYSDNLCETIRQRPTWEVLTTSKLPNDETREALITVLINEIDAPEKEVRTVVNKMLEAGGDEIVNQSETDYRYDEYKAFLGEIAEGDRHSKNFSIEILNGAEYKISDLSKVVLVHRLREIRALVAFSRIYPLDRDDFGLDEEDEKVEVSAVPVRENPDIEWFPAIEVRGEGIFISFDEQHINKWSNKSFVQERCQRLQERLNILNKKYKKKDRNITPKLILLHSFAHVLIRQLSFECGYSSASLRERIYCNEKVSDDNKMAGILIYTASGDSEGTLGGLVRQGKSDVLPAIMERGLQQASWCSSDPICIESRGQGMGALNLAACHSCLLLPETCCEENNRLLDRGLLVGTPENPSIGFFSNLIGTL